MLQVLRIMKNYARKLNACLNFKVCSMTRKAQVGKWCMWIMRMMYFLLGMIPGSKFCFVVLCMHALIEPRSTEPPLYHYSN